MAETIDDLLSKDKDLQAKNGFSDAGAEQALRALLSRPDAPAAAVATAARTLLELEGRLGRHAVPEKALENKPLHEMTEAEIDAELARLRPVMRETRRPRSRK